MKCAGCGAELQSGVRFCPYCGKEQPKQESESSGEQHIHIHTHYDQQPYQAAPQVNVNYNQPPQGQYVQPVQYVQPMQPVQYVQPVPQTSPKNRLTALLLDLFLGGLGVHRFYMGHTGLGVLYLLTFGLCGIGCFVDLMILLLGTPKDGFGREIKW